MRVKALRELISPQALDRRVRELAARINEDYRGRDVIVLCVLNGAFMFFADLVRRLEVDPLLDFLRVASYGKNDESSGTVSFTKDVELSLAGKDVLIVEDIVDTGRTMAFLMEEIRSRGVNSLRLAALVDKVERRTVNLAVDYAGFTIPSGFIVGYGLDYAERFRELPGIYVVELEE